MPRGSREIKHVQGFVHCQRQDNLLFPPLKLCKGCSLTRWEVNSVCCGGDLSLLTTDSSPLPLHLCLGLVGFLTPRIISGPIIRFLITERPPRLNLRHLYTPRYTPRRDTSWPSHPGPLPLLPPGPLDLALQRPFLSILNSRPLQPSAPTGPSAPKLPLPSCN